MKRRLMFLAVSAIALSLTACSFKPNTNSQDGKAAVDKKGQLSSSCQEGKGTWLDKYQECENVSQEWCDGHQGYFDGCASACRHDDKQGEAAICTMQCVFVCSFSKPAAVAPFVNNPENASYVIGGQEVSLVNGEGSASSSKSSFKAFGEPAYNDIDGNGTDDSVMFIVESTASSTDYHLVASLLGVDGLYSNTNSLPLGGGILPKSISLAKGIITVKYDEIGKDGQPSGKSLSKKAAFKAGKLVFTK